MWDVCKFYKKNPIKSYKNHPNPNSTKKNPIKSYKNHPRDFVKNNLPVLIGRCPILIDYALSELLRLKLNFQSIEALKGRRRLGYGNAILTGKLFFTNSPNPNSNSTKKILLNPIKILQILILKTWRTH